LTKRRTPQRAAIAEILRSSDRFRSAQEIHEELRGRGDKVGLATVYRTLQDLVIDEKVDVLRTPVGESAYRSCETPEHHHHLVCTSCGVSVEIENPALERWAQNSATEHGFTHQSHTAEIYGLCARCKTS
jgi:Fur family ferric uptake transcriptional regulator